DEASCEPGDLIFYEASETKRICHVEIFLGDGTSVGSLPWSSHSRTGSKDGVQVFDDFRICSQREWPLLRTHFHSLRPWLRSQETSFAHAQLVLAKEEQAAKADLPACDTSIPRRKFGSC
ncbi:unnamed protein product, partial [Polarella glacialis]